MPLRVGIDLVAVSSVRALLAEHGEHFLERVYTAREIEDCSTAGVPDPERLAGRFAAKEAAMKVLRPGPDDGIGFAAIEVRRHASGWIELGLRGSAAALARDAGLGDLAVSLAHENEMVTAVVVAEVDDDCR